MRNLLISSIYTLLCLNDYFMVFDDKPRRSAGFHGRKPNPRKHSNKRSSDFRGSRLRGKVIFSVKNILKFLRINDTFAVLRH